MFDQIIKPDIKNMSIEMEKKIVNIQDSRDMVIENKNGNVFIDIKTKDLQIKVNNQSTLISFGGQLMWIKITDKNQLLPSIEIETKHNSIQTKIKNKIVIPASNHTLSNMSQNAPVIAVPEKKSPCLSQNAPIIAIPEEAPIINTSQNEPSINVISNAVVHTLEKESITQSLQNVPINGAEKTPSVSSTENVLVATNNKKTILIVGYYHLADGFKTCANYLSKDYNVEFFPLLAYHNYKLNVRDNLINVINGRLPIDKLDYDIHTNSGYKADIVLLWYHSYFSCDDERLQLFEQVRLHSHKDAKFIGYSWDPITAEESLLCTKSKFIKLLDYYLTGDHAEILKYQQCGGTNINYCPSGFDPAVSKHIKDPRYECDVSIICSTLYDNHKLFPLESTRLNRKVLVDLLYENRHVIKFHIYGPQFLSKLYPDCYRGFIAYSDCSYVFSNSKINLCIHAVSYNSEGDNLYFSERLPQILGSKGLLYCETEYKKHLIPNEHYVLADNVDPIRQIKHILANYENYRNLIDKGHEFALQSLTWDCFRQKINDLIQ